MNAHTDWFKPQQTMDFNAARGATPIYASGTMGSGTAGVFGGNGSGNFGQEWNFDPSTVPVANFNSGQGVVQQTIAGGIPVGANPSLFGDASWQGILGKNGSYTPGKFDTLATYGGVAKDLFGLWNNFQAGKLAKENFKLQRDQLDINKKLAYGQARMGIENQDAQRAANTGLSGPMARQQAEAGSLAKMARYGLV